ncbi:hypothetical protein DNI29_08670 [Hymenobacter sediminis]|uniref:hypothetical protein n=1 Tax=Hymenobacter sediminis TaxID=2218621 RepID=UPI000F50B773|nr:hypothetical protein [Hymenobacter sediminis]RPD48676.1 hypothetical protein DNI29_08670 [Hymenobacter sediminis]
MTDVAELRGGRPVRRWHPSGWGTFGGSGQYLKDSYALTSLTFPATNSRLPPPATTPAPELNNNADLIQVGVENKKWINLISGR